MAESFNKNTYITKSAKRVRNKRNFQKFLKILFLIIILLITVFYIAANIIYNSGNFTITLDRNLYLEKNIIIYDDPLYKVFRTELSAPAVEHFDNIKESWLPDDLDKYEGSNNGESYISYSFYVENIGDKVSDYWSELVIDEVYKDVDQAIRVRLYKNGEYVTYAKMGSNGNPEPNTTPFETSKLMRSENVKNLRPGDIDKYTIVVWIEGTDPECTDNIIGGEIKISMQFNSEFIDYPDEN